MEGPPPRGDSQTTYLHSAAIIFTEVTVSVGRSLELERLVVLPVPVVPVVPVPVVPVPEVVEPELELETRPVTSI